MVKPNLIIRKLTRSQFIRLLMLASSSAVVLAACGSNSTDTSSDSPGASTDQPLTVGTEGTYPPFSFRDLQSNELTGYDIDIATEVAKRLGRPIEFVPTQWKSMLASLDAKRFDFVANQVSVTPEREQQYAFSQPYTVSGAVVLVSQDNPKNIQSVNDLSGKVVGTTQGSNFAKAAEEAGAEVKYYQGIAQVLTDLQQNRVDAALNDRLYVLTELQEANYRVKSVGEPFTRETTAFAFRKDNTELRDQVNQALDAIKQDGTLANISNTWFGEDVSR
ncbi:transporter substrate-binding domain-containing protein [Oculatella sp. FACHB-28]|uniref:transporter substrate-binding domain-containing protein n=1 Tax=Oculatella sp. FACHB-28 TaxID=2692845 RepID=UPI0018EF7AB1|nr:transporter substrate-binding domain-containing protein [Oculatella sp. FACHB-28]